LLAITNGRIYTITQGILPRGDILVENGKIVAIGTGLPVPSGATVVDATGKYVFPGFVEAHGHAGVMEDGFGWEGRDGNELTDPVTAHVRAIDAINPEEQGLRDAVEGGVTTLWSTPGSGNVIGGDGVTIKTHGRGRTVDEMIIKYPSGLKAAMGENPKRVYGNQKKMPSTRMGVAGVMREALAKGQNYLQKMKRAAEDPEKPFERDLKMEAIARVLRREIPLRVHAHRADDIMTAVRIAEEFNIEITIEHCTEGHKVADELAKRGIRAVVGPSLTARSKVELRDRTLLTPLVLAKAGVEFAIMTDHPVIPIQYLPFSAALAVREGLDEEIALRAITINAAAIAGVADRVGSLEVGKDADIVVWSDHPFELMSRVLVTIVDGQVVYQREEV